MAGKRNTKNKALKITAVVIIIVILIGAAVYAFIRKKDNHAEVSIDTKEIKTATTATETTTQDIHAGQARSLLTGMWVPKEQTGLRPVAVMYSNIKDAMPQSSISYADVVFESLVEGGITRLCCVFDNQTELTKIGPVRSCRTYYLLFAKEFEAVYVHFGASEYAAGYLANPVFHSLDGMVYCDFYRTTDRIAPHNAYTSWEGIMGSAAYRNYDREYPAGYTPVFTFNTEDGKEITLPEGEECKTFYPGYRYNNPWFTYDEASKTYLRYQFGAEQIDEQTKTQLAYKNILVKYVTPQYYENGTPNYKIHGTNTGIFITNGKAVPVTWAKASESEGATKYYYADGTEVVLNQGKTYICQVETTQEVTISAE
ncbi:MAG: DUF3048 domain-containing protein [Eubacteriales bacterium]|nr:DUF3048 domain-containing protein [Eubacteriales bacterium]